ncbi:MAG TPA: shikimate dehydrogenase [Spirochaetia bacterium]|nr:shikimate dehydrogenase [Spirochaetia bacterium]
MKKSAIPELNFKQELVAVFGKPISENPTQPMIEAAFLHHHLNWRYLTVEVDPTNLADAVRGARAMGFAGFNCTIPHKVSVIQHLDGLGKSAELMGAVNCVVRRGDKLIGENTDGKGFLKALQSRVDPKGKRVLIFGAGGAARAIGVEIGIAGAAHITVVNRNETRGRELAGLLESRLNLPVDFFLWDRTHQVADGTDIVINATSIGLFPDVKAQLDLDFKSLKPGMVVADVIPNPPRTHFVTGAENRGCTVIDGLEMLVNQGVIGIKYWTGVDADADIMRNALVQIFGS